MSVVGDFGEERQRFASARGQLRRTWHLDRWRLVRLRRIGDVGGAAPIFLIDEWAELPKRQQRRVSLFRFAIRSQRPNQILLAPILRHTDLEDELLTTNIKVSRLTLIGKTRLDHVVRTDGK